MNQTDHVERFFDDVTQSLRLKFKGWEQDLPHEGEKGGIRERRVSNFLRSILPQCFGVGSGHIMDKHGNTSGQIDIVIYNALDGIRLPIDEHYSLFPCECVHAAIEVKSTLTASNGVQATGSIHDCVEAAAKVKALRVGNHEPPNDLPFIVFAYQSSWKEPEKIREWFNILGNGNPIPEVVFILGPGYLWCNYRKEPIHTHLYKKAPLLKFLEELLNRMEQVPISNPSLWNEYIEWGTKDVIATYYEYQKKPKNNP